MVLSNSTVTADEVGEVVAGMVGVATGLTSVALGSTVLSVMMTVVV